MIHWKNRNLIILLAILALLTVGCSGVEQPEGRGEQLEDEAEQAEGGSEVREEPPIEMQTIRMGYPTPVANLSEIDTWVGIHKGFFEQYGIHLEPVMLQNDTLALQSLISDEVDISFYANPTVYAAIGSGASIKIFLETTPVHNYQLVTNENIQDWEDFPGTRLGVGSIGAISYFLPRSAMERHNVDPESVQVLAVGGSGERSKALIAGRIDSGVLHTVYALETIRQAPKLKIFANLAQELPEYQFSAWSTKTSFLEENPDLVERFVRASLEAVRFTVENKQYALDLYSELVPEIDVEVASEAFDILVQGGAFGVNGGMAPESYQYTAQTMLESGELEEIKPYEEVYEPRFRDAVLQEIGEYR